MLHTLLNNRRGFVLAVWLSIALHVGAIIAFARFDPVTTTSGQGGSVPAMFVNFVSLRQDLPAKAPATVSPLPQAAQNTPIAPDLPESNHKNLAVLTPPKLTWVKEIDLDALDDYDGTGYVELEVLVDVDGHPAKVTHSDTNLPPMFTDLVTSAFMDARFEPGTLNGKPISEKFRIRINFR